MTTAVRLPAVVCCRCTPTQKVRAGSGRSCRRQAPPEPRTPAPRTRLSLLVESISALFGSHMRGGTTPWGGVVPFPRSSGGHGTRASASDGTHGVRHRRRRQRCQHDSGRRCWCGARVGVGAAVGGSACEKKKGPQLCRARLPYAISSRGSWLGLEYVGVGIVGKEGRQASLAADFSVPQFSHIVRLLCTCCSTCVWGWERDRP